MSNTSSALYRLNINGCKMNLARCLTGSVSFHRTRLAMMKTLMPSSILTGIPGSPFSPFILTPGGPGTDDNRVRVIGIDKNILSSANCFCDEHALKK